MNNFDSTVNWLFFFISVLLWKKEGKEEGRKAGREEGTKEGREKIKRSREVSYFYNGFSDKSLHSWLFILGPIGYIR